MDWDKEALEIVEAIPLPPMIAHFAKMDAERRAGNKVLHTIMATSKNVIPVKTGIYNQLNLLDSRLRGSDR